MTLEIMKLKFSFHKYLSEYHHAHLFIYVLSMTIFVPPWQNRVVVTETLWSTKPKILCGPLQKTFTNISSTYSID